MMPNPVGQPRAAVGRRVARLLLVTLTSLFVWHSNATGQFIDKKRFTPLEVGNVWEYTGYWQFWKYDPENPHSEPGERALRGFIRTGVPSDTVINDERYLTIQRWNVDSLGSSLSSRSCLLKVDSTGGILFPMIEGGAGLCQRGDAIDYQYPIPVARANLEIPYRFIWAPDTIGTVVVAATASIVSGKAHAALWRLDYAADVGLYRWTDSNPPYYADGYVVSYWLTYARVGEREYEFPPPPPMLPLPVEPIYLSLAGRVGVPYPNPTQGEFELPISDLEPGDLAYAVFDLLGRRVVGGSFSLASGQTSVDIDLTGHLPGMYLIRFVRPDQEEITRTVVVL